MVDETETLGADEGNEEVAEEEETEEEL